MSSTALGTTVGLRVDEGTVVYGLQEGLELGSVDEITEGFNVG